MENLNTIGLLALGLLILIKDVVRPLVKRLNHRNDDPINLDKFYQEFKDFKDNQMQSIEKLEKRIEKLEDFIFIKTKDL